MGRWGRLRRGDHNTSHEFTDLIKEIQEKAQEQQATRYGLSTDAATCHQAAAAFSSNGIGDAVFGASTKVKSEKENLAEHRFGMRSELKNLVGIMGNMGTNSTVDIMSQIQALADKGSPEQETVLDEGLFNYKEMMIAAYIGLRKNEDNTDQKIISKLVKKIESWRKYGPVRGQGA